MKKENHKYIHRQVSLDDITMELRSNCFQNMFSEAKKNHFRHHSNNQRNNSFLDQYPTYDSLEGGKKDRNEGLLLLNKLLEAVSLLKLATCFL